MSKAFKCDICGCYSDNELAMSVTDRYAGFTLHGDMTRKEPFEVCLICAHPFVYWMKYKTIPTTEKESE